MDQNHLNNFGGGPPKDHLCEIILKLDQGFRSYHISQLLTDIGRWRTTDGQRPITKAHLVTTWQVSRVKQGIFVKIIFPTPAKGYFRESYKSQNVNSFYPTPKFI